MDCLFVPNTVKNMIFILKAYLLYNPIGKEIKLKVEWRTVDILTDKPYRKYKLKY